METREQAIAWWNLLSNAARMAFCNKMDDERFQTRGVPPWPDPTVTGREIEQMWEQNNRPSSSMNIRELTANDLMGRVVKITGGNPSSTTYTFVNMFTGKHFRVFNSNILFKIGSGSERGTANNWHPFNCVMATREDWDAFSARMKAKRERKILVEAIVAHVERQDSIAPTNEQLTAAALALGLTKE